MIRIRRAELNKDSLPRRIHSDLQDSGLAPLVQLKGDRRLTSELTGSLMPIEAAKQLMAWGITPSTIIEAGPVGYARIEPDGMSYQFSDGGGTDAFILPVRDPDGYVFDLTAWRVDDPATVWTRRGVGTILGAEHASYSSFMGDPVTLWQSPLSWLQANCEGACVIDWSPPLLWSFELGSAQRIKCETPRLHDRLQSKLRTDRRPDPEIRVMYEVSHAA